MSRIVDIIGPYKYPDTLGKKIMLKMKDGWSKPMTCVGYDVDETGECAMVLESSEEIRTFNSTEYSRYEILKNEGEN